MAVADPFDIYALGRFRAMPGQVFRISTLGLFTDAWRVSQVLPVCFSNSLQVAGTSIPLWRLDLQGRTDSLAPDRIRLRLG